MRKNMILFLLLLTLIGCNKSTPLLTAVNHKELNSDVLAFAKQITGSIGIYLYSNGSEDQYLFFNNMIIDQDDQATYIDSFQAEITNRILVVNVKELSTDNLDDNRVGQLIAVKVNREKEFDKIQIYKNEKETNFDLVGG